MYIHILYIYILHAHTMHIYIYIYIYITLCKKILHCFWHYICISIFKYVRCPHLQTTIWYVPCKPTPLRYHCCFFIFSIISAMDCEPEAGTVVGGAIGVLPALFTFGLSIPVGAAIGGGAGTRCRWVVVVVVAVVAVAYCAKQLL